MNKLKSALPDAVLSAGDRLQLRFARRGDRWEHSVQFRTAGHAVWQLDSDEGAADDGWPPSPPFQSLEMHTQPDGRKFALLVGMAGASHWSASIETDPVKKRIVFDVACRIKFEPQWLGSSYLLLDSNGLDNIADDGDVERFPAERPRIETIALESRPDGSLPTVETAGPKILVRPSNLSGRVPRTVRWKYAISATEPAAPAR
jgi:hypothetical protein